MQHTNTSGQVTMGSNPNKPFPFAAKANLVDAGKTPQAVRTPELPAAAAYKGSKKAKSRNGAHKK